MLKQALALALISTAAVACGTPTEEESEGTEARLSQGNLPVESGCVVTMKDDTLFGSYVRVRFQEGPRGAFVTVENYDGETGFAGSSRAYLYKRLPDGDVLLYEARTNQNIQVAIIRFKGGDDALWETIHEHDHLMSEFSSEPPRISATHSAKCDLKAGAPSLSLPIAQRPASTQELTANSRAYWPGIQRSQDDASCVATQLVHGQVLRIAAGARKTNLPFFRVELYDPTTHFLAKNLLTGKSTPTWAKVSDKYVVGGTDPRDRGVYVEYAWMVQKEVDGKLQYVLDSTDLEGLNGTSIPLNCDFIE